MKNGPPLPGGVDACMYGLITPLTALPGRRDELALTLLDPEIPRPGCHSYVVAFDEAREDDVWVSEVWLSEAAHKAALTDAARARLRPALNLIAKFGDSIRTRPIGGVGL